MTLLQMTDALKLGLKNRLHYPFKVRWKILRWSEITENFGFPTYYVREAGFSAIMLNKTKRVDVKRKTLWVCLSSSLHGTSWSLLDISLNVALMPTLCNVASQGERW